MKPKNATKLIAAILMCQLAGLVGSVFTIASIPAWYATLQKPSFAPPNWLFGPAWMTLYTLMGVSLYLVWTKERRGLSKNKNVNARGALQIFGVQLALNALWPILFFGMRSPLYGLIGIAALWAAIVLTISRFSKISKNAAMLLLPYIAWVSFAAILNYYILILNL